MATLLVLANIKDLISHFPFVQAIYCFSLFSIFFFFYFLKRKKKINSPSEMLLQRFRTIFSRLCDSALSLGEIRNTFSIFMQLAFSQHQEIGIFVLFVLFVLFICSVLQLIYKQQKMHASTMYKTEFNSGKGQAPALNFNATPGPVGKGCWGGGSR